MTANEGATTRHGMTIEEAKLKKVEAENRINEILNNLFEETGCAITDITLTDTWMMRQPLLPVRYTAKILTMP
jgi:hypothetical protein